MQFNSEPAQLKYFSCIIDYIDAIQLYSFIYCNVLLLFRASVCSSIATNSVGKYFSCIIDYIDSVWLYSFIYCNVFLLFRASVCSSVHN